MGQSAHFAVGAFMLIAAVSLVGFLRHPEATRRDISLTFGVLAIAGGTALLAEAPFAPGDGAGVVARLAMVVQPYLLVRVLRHIRRVPAPFATIVTACAIISVIAVLLPLETIRLPVLIFIAAYFTLANGYTAVLLIRGAIRASGVARYRMRLAAAGCMLLTVALLLAAEGAVLAVPRDAVTYAAGLLALAAALSFYLGFLPPRILRDGWYNTGLRRFLATLSSGTSDPTYLGVARALQTVSSEITGSSTVAIATRKDGETRWYCSVLGPEATSVATFIAGPSPVPEGSHPHQYLESAVPEDCRLHRYLESATPSAFRARIRDSEVSGIPVSEPISGAPEWIYVVPATSRHQQNHRLIVFGPSEWLFPYEALQTLSLCTEQAAVTLRRIGLVHELRGQSELLETQVRKRTALFQRLSKGFETLYQISDAAHSTAPIEEVLRLALTTICERESFALGHMVSPAGYKGIGTVVPENLWYSAEDDRYASFRHEVDRIESSEQLAGIKQSLTGDEPYWVTGREKLADCIPSLEAEQAGLQTGIFVPVFVEKGCVAVLEFFSTEVRPKSDVPLRILKEAGRMLGHVIAQRKAALEIETNETFFRNTFEQASAGIAQTSPDGQLIKVNRRWAQMLGYSVEELLKVRFMDITVAEDLEHERGYFTQLVEGQIANYTIEKRYVAKDGSLVWVDLTASAVYDSDGTLDYLIGVILDIGERKKLERELRDLTEHLESRVEQQTAHLRTINREIEAFSYSVSHDLRTPLRAIEGFGAALVEDYGEALDDTARDYLQRLRSETRRMGRLIDDMLTLSRLSRTELRMQSVDLGRMAHEILDALHSAEPDRKVSVHIDEPMDVCADPTLTRVLMQNLINNSWKFTRRSTSSRIHIGGNDAGEFFVEDNGAGFDMRYAEKLFGAFQRLHTTHEFEGTGIGLATVQRIVHRHGGSIRANAEENNGAVFTFTLGDDTCE